MQSSALLLSLCYSCRTWPMARLSKVLLLFFAGLSSVANANRPALPPTPGPMSSIAWPPTPAPPAWTPSVPRISTVKAAYWPSYMSDAFPASAIDTSYFTHVYYAFLLPDPASYELMITVEEDQKLANFITELHGKRPRARAMLSIGGGGNNATTFALMASSLTSRASFINSTIMAARKYGFSGVDLDWEFPENQEEMGNLGILFREWRAALLQEAKDTGRRRLRITAAVYFAAEFFLDKVYRKYPGGSISKNLDWVNAMCFDYSGPWSPWATGAPAALYSSSNSSSNVTTSYGIESWINAGIPPWKVTMGLPLYGRTWQLRYPSVNSIGAPAVGLGPGNGTLIYSAVVEYNAQNNATVVYDLATVSTYSYVGATWIGYDDATSVKKKISYAQGEKNLRGYFFWALRFDKDWAISKQASDAWDS